MDRTLFVPGFKGSGPEHWQTWMQAQVCGSRRVTDIDWDQPVLAWWATQVCRAIDAAQRPVWLVAHSFGCLASVVAIAERPGQVAGALLVAPADPSRFTLEGLAAGHAMDDESIDAWLPQAPLPCPTVLVASTDDPWMRLTHAGLWAQRWGSRLEVLGAKGHINAASGFGPWPEGLRMLEALKAGSASDLVGCLDDPLPRIKGRGSHLSRLRHQTRSLLSSL